MAAFISGPITCNLTNYFLFSNSALIRAHVVLEKLHAKFWLPLPTPSLANRSCVWNQQDSLIRSLPKSTFLVVGRNRRSRFFEKLLAASIPSRVSEALKGRGVEAPARKTLTLLEVTFSFMESFICVRISNE